MAQRRRFSAEYKREVVVMLNAPGVNVSQIAADMGIGTNVLGRWRRGSAGVPQQGRSRDEEVASCY